MITIEKPAEPVGLNGLSEVVSRGSRHPEYSPNADQIQRQWDTARRYEQQFQGQARAALCMRGQDRLQALALAFAFGGAARSTVAQMGGQR